LTDYNIDYCLDAFGVLKTLAVVVVAAGWSCREQKQMINQVLCISRRMFSLLTLILSLVGPFCPATIVLHGCNLFSLLGVVTPRLSSRICSKTGCCILFFCALPMEVSTPAP
jgi:hypothetical protein